MESFIGTVIKFAGNFAPEGWLLCNGQTLEINNYQALYSIIGNRYGGDGAHDFNIPNLNDPTLRLNVGPVWIICVDGIYPSRP
jgi:microcystin-dependent protein